MKLIRSLIALLLLMTPAVAGMQIGPLTTGSSQGGGGGSAPVVTSHACTIVLPVQNGVDTSLLSGGGACTYSATCAGVMCTGGNAITAWAVTAQSTANSFSVTNNVGGGTLQGGSAAGSVTAGSYTVTVTATNSTGTSPGVVQNVTVANTIPTVQSHACTISTPVTNGVNVSPTCTYTALCDAQACVSPYAITSWAITAQSCAGCFAITNAGVLQGGANAVNVTTGTTPTVTLTATNAVGTSSGVVETVTVSSIVPVVTAHNCTISSPVTNGSNVVQTQGAGNCTFAATCGGGACSGGNAITSWAIGTQSCSACYSITSGAVLQGGPSGANVGTEVDTVTVTATNSTGTSAGQVQTITAYADGSIGASAGTAQYPTILNGYAARSPWNVAGVDYIVGATGALTPYTGQAVTGWVYTPGANANLSTVSNNPATLSGYDFSAIDNFQIRCFNTNVTVSNVLLKVINTSGLAQEPIRLLGGCSNFTLTKSTVDGGNGLVLNGGELVFLGTNVGTTILTYNYFKNTYSQFVSNGAGTGSVTAKWNLFDQALSVGGAHSDWYEGESGTAPMVGWNWLFNTGYQHGSSGNGTQGWMFEPGNGVTISNLTASNNTAIALGTSNNLVNFFFGLGGLGVEVVTNANFNNNYVDPTKGAGGNPVGFIRAQVSGSHGSGNINMITGSAAAGSTW